MPSARIMITIPSELNERLEPFRSRLNLSKIAAEAIEQRVSELEEATPKAERIADWIVQFNREIREGADRQGDFYRSGFVMGAEFTINSNLNTLKPYQQRTTPIKAEDLPEIAADELRDLLSEQKDRTQDEKHTRRFLIGFEEGIKEMWAKVVAELNPEE